MRGSGFLTTRNYIEFLEGSQMEKVRADGGVCPVDDAQAHLHEEGSVEGDWIFGEVELDLLDCPPAILKAIYSLG
jgi:hypothetical protein